MAIIDLDSHLREAYFMDEIYKLEGPYEKFTPVRIQDGQPRDRRYRHSLEPRNPRSRAAYNHNYMYDPRPIGAAASSRRGRSAPMTWSAASRT